MDLPKDYFRDKNPADIIAKVATITLANISLLGAPELERIGWLNNPIVDKLYSLTSAGQWVVRVDASGYPKIEAGINTYISKLDASRRFVLPPFPTVNYIPDTPTEDDHSKILLVPLSTDGAGAVGVTGLVIGGAASFPVMDLLGIWSPDTDPATTLAFTVDAGTLIGPATLVVALTASTMTLFANGAYVPFYCSTDDSDIRVAVSGAPASKTLFLVGRWHLET